MRTGGGISRLSSGILLAVLCTVPAFTLTWYSYREPGGRIVVVDDLEEVPLDCRDSVRAERVGPKVRPASPTEPGTPPMSLVSEDPDVGESVGTGQLEVPEEILPADTGIRLVSENSTAFETASETPEMRAERLFTASAGICLQELIGLQDRGELIWGIAKRLGPSRPELRFQHSQGLATLAGPWMSWASQADSEKHREWLNRVRVLIEQYRTLFFTISQRLMTNSAALLGELPALLNRIRVNLEWVKQNRPIPMVR